MNFRFQHAFLDSRWQSELALSVDEQGRYSKAENNAEHFYDSKYVIGGIPNVHSHAFQRAFVGLSEFKTGDRDSFWTWRNLMYRFLEQLSPEDIYVIARQLFIEMLKSGYTSVGEFQYIHNDRNGSPFQQPDLICDRIVHAAVDVGIRICILPVLYQRGGFDNRPLEGGQLRFGLTDDQFLAVNENLKKRWAEHPLVSMGVAFHSLRAFDPAKIETTLQSLTNVPDERFVVHVHISEQQAEVEQCLTSFNRRPVEWLFDHADIDERWCLIHATHLNDSEVKMIAASGATVGLCPLTEANLGDGFFRIEDFAKQNGNISIGSDSHISINPFSELRMIEYGVRLRNQNRAILCADGESCGDWLLSRATAQGNSVVSQSQDFADFLILDENHPGVFGAVPERINDKLVFFESQNPVRDVFVGGSQVIESGTHVLEKESQIAFENVIQKLK